MCFYFIIHSRWNASIVFFEWCWSFTLMECLAIDVLPRLNCFGRKWRHTHILGLGLLVAIEVPTHQSRTSQAFVKYPLCHHFPARILKVSLEILLELTYMTLFLFHLSQSHYLPESMGLNWLQLLFQSQCRTFKWFLFLTYSWVLQLHLTFQVSIQRYPLECAQLYI